MPSIQRSAARRCGKLWLVHMAVEVVVPVYETAIQIGIHVVAKIVLIDGFVKLEVVLVSLNGLLSIVSIQKDAIIDKFNIYYMNAGTTIYKNCIHTFIYIMNSNLIKKFLVIIAILFCFNSCNKHESHDEFDNTKIIKALSFDSVLKGKAIPIDNEKAELLYPLRILNLNDTYLIISDYKPKDIFLVFRIPELEYLYGWGREGRGPDEFPVSRVREINQRGDELILFEPISQNLRFYAVEDTGFVKVEEQLLMYEGQLGDPLYQIRRLNDSLYIADYGTSFEDTRYEHIALRPGQEEGLFYFGRYPEVDLHNVLRYEEFLKLNAVHPNGTKFAVFYIYQNQIKIYNSHGEELKNVKIEDPYVEHEKTIGDFFQYRTQPWATENYLYTLGLNVPREKFSEELIIPTLEVWNWEGRQVYRASFDRPVNGFTVSEKYGKLYAYSLQSTDEIYEYDLPELPGLNEE